jgi:hypothetical protein
LILLDSAADAETTIQVRPRETLEEAERQSVRAWADAETAKVREKLKEFRVRPDSWQAWTVGESTAVRCTADFVMGDQKRAQYWVFVLGESTAAFFSAHTDPARLDEFREKLDPVISSYKET